MDWEKCNLNPSCKSLHTKHLAYTLDTVPCAILILTNCTTKSTAREVVFMLALSLMLWFCVFKVVNLLIEEEITHAEILKCIQSQSY